jgi:hypothetical protein
MTDPRRERVDADREPTLDVAAYCRRVEEHLTQVNEGHLVRIVGQGFELVRRWATTGVPLAVVCRGISARAERHRARRVKRPLRIEFCEGDVAALYDQWRRAVGVGTGGGQASLVPAEVADDASAADADIDAPRARRPSLVRHIDRAIERLARLGGRLDWPDDLQRAVQTALEALGDARELARARGSDRAVLADRLRAVDAALIRDARASLDPAAREAVRAEAVENLAAYRARMDPAAWETSVDRSIDAVVRERFLLPTIDPDA